MFNTSVNTVTNGIRVQVESHFLPEHSNLDEGLWLFAYIVNIYNESEKTAQLLRRHWFIVDGWGEVSEVEGEGVIGETPVLSPGQSHSYSSFCHLATPTGEMSGYYTFTDDNGNIFRAEIGTFSLSEPTSLN